MGTTFTDSWDQYRRRYSQNQAYLDAFSDTQILSAVGRAYVDHYWPNRAHNMLAAACDFGGGGDVSIEQGPHQPEDMAPFGGGGICLHVTARHNGTAFHMYVQQTDTGALEVIDITW